MNKEIIDKIEQVLSQIRPALHMDGGGIEFVDYSEETGEVHVKMQGACVGCPMSEITLKMGVEAVLKESIPEVTRVVSVSSHENS